MSTSYNTSAKPRNRREVKTNERPVRAATPNDASQLLSKKISQTSEEESSSVSRKSPSSSPTASLVGQKESTRDSSRIVTELGTTRTLQNDHSQAGTLQNDRSSATSASSKFSSDPVQQSFSPSIPGSWPMQPSSTAVPAALPATTRDFVSSQAFDSQLPEESTPTTQNSSRGTKSEQVSLGSSHHASTMPISIEDALASSTKPPPETETRQDQSRERVVTPQQYSTWTHMDPLAYPQPQHFLARQRDLDERSSISAGYSTGSPPCSPPPPNPYYAYPSQASTPYPYVYPQQMMPGYNVYNVPYQPFPPPTEFAPYGVPEERSLRPDSADEHARLIEKVSSVLPDIDRLLSHYHSNRGQSVTSASLTPVSQTEHAEQLRRLQVEVEANKHEYGKVIDNLVARNNDLEREVVLLRDGAADMQKPTIQHQQLKDELRVSKAAYQDLLQQFEAKQLMIESLEAAKDKNETLIASLQEDQNSVKELHDNAIRDLKQQHKDQFAAREIEHNNVLADYKTNLSRVQLELAGFITKHNSHSKDLQAALSAETEWKRLAESKTKEIEELSLQHTRGVEKLRQQHQEEIEAIKASTRADQQRVVEEAKSTEQRLIQEYGEKEKTLTNQLDSAHAELQSCKDNLRNEQESTANLRHRLGTHEVTHVELGKRLSTWTSINADLHKESTNLGNLLQSLIDNAGNS